MSILPKHNDQYSHYDVKQDLTKEQLHRFTEVANSVQHKREQCEDNAESTDPRLIHYVKRTACTPLVRPKPDKPNTVRYAVWMVLFGIVCLWAMYMFR